MKLFNRIFAALTATLIALTLILSAAHFVGFDVDAGSEQVAAVRLVAHR